MNWLRTDYPFRPGAAYSGDRFGFRTVSHVGSPFHPGTDRAGRPDHIVMPFDGSITYSVRPGTDWGSLARIVPATGEGFEIQIAHTIRRDGLRTPLENQHYTQGAVLPIVAGDIGLSMGAHTHTELLVEHTAKHYARFRTDGGVIYKDGAIQDDKIIREHCNRYGLDYSGVIFRLMDQIHRWSIVEVWKSFIVRSVLPDYRTPHWGSSGVIIADTRRYLDL